jgi:phytoene/squalene synthetase
MKQLFDEVSLKCSQLTTRSYSTSFSLGIRLLSSEIRSPIYAIYGFVRFADEIVDTFHDYNKPELLKRFCDDTYTAIEEGISLNPILNAFQQAVRQYDIPMELIDQFLHSMEMDLDLDSCDRNSFEEYILGSAEVVGLMCLKVFVGGNQKEYERLKPYAMALGAAFQKINFLRDLHADYEKLGRSYFPGLDVESFDENSKKRIEEEIAEDFKMAYEGIVQLPKKARFGVYLAYVYYLSLFKKIQNTPSSQVIESRIRIPNERKYAILVSSYVKHQIGWI